MASLKEGERRQRCLHHLHHIIRTQTYYVVRPYFNELENSFCQGCLSLMARADVVKREEGQTLGGYIPIKGSVESLLKLHSK